MKRILALPILLLICAAAHAQIPSSCTGSNTYYFSSGIGSDSNTQAQARNKATPWAHHPYMRNFTGTYVHTAGDCFVFRGGDSWGAASFGIHIPLGGTSSAADYYGVDLTWFTGGGFTRPKFDSAQQFAANGNHIIDTAGASGSGCLNGAGCPGVPYLTFDNIEIVNSLVHLAGTNVDNTGLMVFGGQHSSAAAVGVTVENMFIHDWASTDNSTSTALFSYGTIYGATTVTNTTISDQNGYGFIGGVKTNTWSSGGCIGCGELKNSIIHHAWVVCSSCTTIHDNESYNIDATALTLNGAIHTHAYYQDGGGPQAQNPHDTISVYNNYHHDSTVSLIIAVCYNTAVFNNLVDNSSGNVSVELDMCNDDSASVVGEVVNNTFNTGTNVFNESCWRTPSATPGLGTIRIQNNFCIPSSGSAGGVNTTHQIIGNNLVTSLASANGAGYNSANKFKNFPAPGPTSTVAYGVNLTSLATGNLAALSKDAEGTAWAGFGCYLARPTGSTPWDAGWVQSPGCSGGTPPTVTVTQPSGTISGTVTITVTASGGTISSIQPLVDGATFGNACTSSPCNVLWNTTLVGNGTHTVGGTATNGTGQGTATPVSVTVNNSTPGCTTSAATWTNTSFTTQTGSFTATLTVTPNGIPPAGTGGPVVGLSQTAAQAYGSNSALIRQSDNGFWEVYNPASPPYSHATPVSWIVGTSAAFTWQVNVVAQTASVQVTQNSVTSTLGTNVGFRATATSLGFWNLDPENPPTTLQVCNFALGATGSLTPTSFNFGTVNVGAPAVSQAFTLTNNGGSPLSWTAFNISPSVYTIASNSCVSPLAIGASCPLTVQFAPATPTSYPGTLSLTTGATVNSVALSGAGSSVSAPSVPTGLTATATGTTISLSWIASTGTAPLTYNVSRSIVTGGPYTSIVTGLTGTSYTDPNLTPATYYYVVSATNAAGTSANSNEASGVITPSLPQANLTPASLSFGNVAIGASGSLNETVSNVGTANLVIGTPTVGGANLADFAFTAGCTSATVPANSSCSTLVTFTPSTTTTQEQATLCFPSNAASSPDCLTMTGQGVAPVVISPSTLNFGNIFVNKTSSAQVVTYANNSGSTVTFTSVAITGGDSTQFTLGANTCSGTLATGSTCTTSITFTPNNPGLKASNLVYTDSATGSPHSVALAGNAKSRRIAKSL